MSLVTVLKPRWRIKMYFTEIMKTKMLGSLEKHTLMNHAQNNQKWVLRKVNELSFDWWLFLFLIFKVLFKFVKEICQNDF